MPYFTDAQDLASPFFKVEGWVNKHMPDIMRFAARMMTFYGTPPVAAAEIGVHHGRFFLVLEELCQPEGLCDAFDVFEDQFRNLDGSGRGSMARFLGNVKAYARAPDRVRAIKVDSIDLAAGVSAHRDDVRYNLFSIDGCHTALHTCNDLQFAQRTVLPGGIVVVDDINNMSWMGVFEGVCRYLASPAPRLAPFGVGLNKLLMAPVGDQKRYFEYFRDHRAEVVAVPSFQGGPTTTHLSGYQVFRYGQ